MSAVSITLSDPEPSKDGIYRDKDGDFWWWEFAEDGWVWSSSLVNAKKPGRGSGVMRWRDIAGSLFPMTRVQEEEPTGAALQDSGARTQYAGGGVRDSAEGKPRFDLLWPKEVPYEEQFLTQMAQIMRMGAEKYDERNWEAFHTPEALAHAQASLGRHYGNYMAGSTDEPHLFLMGCNLLMIATIEWKIKNGWVPAEKEES